jgi:Holliday junction resolvasome RuvABC endonuclease subunit
MDNHPCVMGVDCGFGAMGVVILDSDETIIDAASICTQPDSKKLRIRKSDDDARRCEVLARGLRDIILLYKPKAMFVELPSAGAKSARAAHAMGMSKGIIATVAQLLDIPVSYYLPHDSKRAAAGANNASKEEVQAAVCRRWPDAKWPTTQGEAEHCYDAAAVLMAAAPQDPLYKVIVNAKI